MAVSPNAAFNLTADLILESALARLGGEQETGFDARSARRNMQVMFRDWVNRGSGAPLWEVDTATIPLVAGQATYVMTGDTVDVFEMYLSDTAHPGSDTPVSRMSRPAWMALPDKASPGMPVQAMVDRQRDAPVLTLWPVPDRATYELTCARWKMFRDVDGLGQGLDIPTRFLPAAISGLAFYMGRERPQTISPDVLARLKADYDEDFVLACQEDRDRGPFRMTPDFGAYRRR